MSLSDKERNWIDCHFAKMQEQITLVRIDIAKLKVKSGFWGLLGGAISVLITMGIYLLLKGV